jgi:hypothetical protein
MPTQGRLVNSGYPALPFYVNDHGQDSLFSITIASGQGVLAGGTILEENGAGLYEAYGSGTAAGILMNRVDATDENVLGSMMVHGVVRSGSLFGFDAGAVTDLPNIKFV